MKHYIHTSVNCSRTDSDGQITVFLNDNAAKGYELKSLVVVEDNGIDHALVTMERTIETATSTPDPKTDK